jgi:ABC-2 type transport system permease protein
VTTEPTGAVFDLGYVPHTGPRLGRRGAVKAVIADGIRRILGLRRKARKKILPWALFAFALLPAIVFVGLAYFLSNFAPDAESPFGGYSEYFSLVAGPSLIFIALAVPELLIPDRIQGVLAVYSSRPLRARDYLLSRLASLSIVLAGFLIVPQLLLYAGFAALDPGGIVHALVSNLDNLAKILATALAFVVAYGSPAVIVATFAKRLAPASGAYLGVMFVSKVLAESLTGGSSSIGDWVSLVALLDHALAIRDWVFREVPTSVMGRAGFSPWMSVAVLALLAVAASWIAIRRYREWM